MRIHSKEYAAFLQILLLPKNILETSKKLWESRKKIRQRESEKAKSLPGTLKISYTFIRYIP